MQARSSEHQMPLYKRLDFVRCLSSCSANKRGYIPPIPGSQRGSQTRKGRRISRGYVFVGLSPSGESLFRTPWELLHRFTHRDEHNPPPPPSYANFCNAQIVGCGCRYCTAVLRNCKQTRCGYTVTPRLALVLFAVSKFPWPWKNVPVFGEWSCMDGPHMFDPGFRPILSIV